MAKKRSKMADLQDAAVGAGAADQVVGLGEIGGDRLLQEHVNALLEEEPGDLVVGAGRHRDADGIDEADQVAGVGDGPHAVALGDTGRARGVQVGDRDQAAAPGSAAYLAAWRLPI